MRFRACAKNAEGLTFSFTFDSQGWGQEYVEKDVVIALDKIVQSDPMHQKYGPWEIMSMDVTS